jgi:hypothetical protein
MARASSRPFNELLQHYAIERFLYRLSNTGHADQFVLKGALMLSVWGHGTSRPTMDIDLLGRIHNNLGEIADAVRDACVRGYASASVATSETPGLPFRSMSDSAM